MADRIPDFSHLTTRPPESERLFVSETIEDVIAGTAAKIHDPELRRMFEQCYPNTLDTTVHYREDQDGEPDTFVYTGDIPAMWLRDSHSQLKPYLPFVNHDPKLKKLFAGLVRRQAESVIIDQYANAFVDPYLENPPKTPHWPHGDGWHPGVWERKYELDSLAAFFATSHEYYDATKDTRPFDGKWLHAVRLALNVLRWEQLPVGYGNQLLLHKATMPNGEPFPAVANRGWGQPGYGDGLVRNLFRPSDDEAELPYLIPANAMMAVSLHGLYRLLGDMRIRTLARASKSNAQYIESAIQKHGIVNDPNFGEMFAYEVNGRGSRRLMDDPNVPSLLSLPYLGYTDIEDPVYQNTRAFILSDNNSYYARGKFEGLTSPHVGDFNMFWPIATIMQIMTSNDDMEIKRCLRTLQDTHAGTYFMHEAINVDNPRDYSRPWFGWANSLFGEMILDLNNRKPHILTNEI